MKSTPKQIPGQTSFISPDLIDQLNPKHRLVILANKICWKDLEESLSCYYAENFGRPAKPIRLMTGLLILKQMENLSDERVVEAWVQNPYMQYFCGEDRFQWQFPCDPSDLTYFRNRIGEKGVEKVLELSIKLFGKMALEKEVVIDTTVQEKNITYPTDAKLYGKIIEKCRKIADKEQIALRRSYSRTVKELMLAQRFAAHPKNHKKAKKAQKQLNTIAGRLVRELDRKLSQEALRAYKAQLALFEKVLKQKKKDKRKIYSLHEPEVYCMSKGKAHKTYEFGAKASITMTKTHGIILGAMSFQENIYDSHTLEPVLDQVEALRGDRPKVGICDRGYRGKAQVGQTQILIPKSPGKTTTAYEKQKARKRFRRRAGIEPVIGHLKSDYRLGRNFLKGVIGDSINLMMAAAAFNFTKWLRMTVYFFSNLVRRFDGLFMEKTLVFQ